jgi:hypothetical protein
MNKHPQVCASGTAYSWKASPVILGTWMPLWKKERPSFPPDMNSCLPASAVGKAVTTKKEHYIRNLWKRK